jgi:ligand-binding sensor domain-containing protein
MPKLFCWIGSLLTVLLFQYENGHAQKNKIAFNHLTVENGLSQSSVFSIAQDSMGFMWFGTKDGLNKYNTRNFEVFKREKGNPNSITTGQNVNALYTDKSGQLWIGTHRD